MARTTVYNKITTPEKIQQILPENKTLLQDFLVYLQSIDRSASTIKQYKSDIEIFFVYNLEYNSNKDFTKLSKRDIIKFQNHMISEWNWSPNRIKRVKSALSSMSNYIENILDDEYPNFRNIINKIESPTKALVREKTIFTEEELQKLLDHLTDTKQYKKAAVLALAMYSGRRKAEIPRFKVSYFKDENVLFNSLWKTDEKVITKGRGSKGKQIYLYVLKDKFEPYLNLWLKEREENNINSDWLFPSIKDPSQQLNVASMDGWAVEFTKFLGKDFYWHSMRHFFTTMLARQNVPSSVIQDIINWESADMVTLYTDISSDENIGRYFNQIQKD